LFYQNKTKYWVILTDRSKKMKTEILIKALSGNATDEEKEHIDAWLQESEQNRKEYEKTSVLWNRLEGVYDKTDFNKYKLKNAIQSKILKQEQKTKRSSRFYKYSVAVAIVLLIGVSFIFYYTIHPDQQNYQVYSSGNSVKEIFLTDGSHVWLNSNSSLALPSNFSKKHRNVTLHGEAYFEIEHDANNPFKVNAGKTVTEVLGTSFNLKLDTILGNVNLIVNSGKVSFCNISDMKNKVILLPGNYANFLKQEETIKAGSNEDLNFLSWKTGTLKFYNTPIDKVCDELSMHFNKKVLSTITTKDLKLTGTFNDDSLEEILTTIELTLDVHLSRLNSEYRIEN
jgi:transmembrane sensor